MSMRGILVCSRQMRMSLGLFSRKEALAELRRRTSLSFVICKQALDKFGDNLDAAEKWAHEEAKRVGAQKAARVAHRQVAQGVVAVQKGEFDQIRTCTILEVRCETDFVARNSRFHEFVAQLFGEYRKVSDKMIRERFATDLKLGKYPLEGYRLSKTQPDAAVTNTQLSDFERTNMSSLFRQAITSFGENVALHRGILLCAREAVQLASFVHNAGHDVPTVLPSGDKPVQLGRYAVALAYRLVQPQPVSTSTSSASAPTPTPTPAPVSQPPAEAVSTATSGEQASPDEDADVAMRSATQFAKSRIVLSREEVPNYVCQHIVAMRPKRIGERRAGAAGDATVEKQTDTLIGQEYLHDETRTVGDLLAENGVAIDDFVRFECGEGDAQA